MRGLTVLNLRPVVESKRETELRLWIAGAPSRGCCNHAMPADGSHGRFWGVDVGPSTTPCKKDWAKVRRARRAAAQELTVPYRQYTRSDPGSRAGDRQRHLAGAGKALGTHGAEHGQRIGRPHGCCVQAMPTGTRPAWWKPTGG